MFGRDAGYTALYTAYVTEVRCCILEYKVDLKHLIDLLIQDKRNRDESDVNGRLISGVLATATSCTIIGPARKPLRPPLIALAKALAIRTGPKARDSCV
jgi:hypothetical protein